MQHYFQCFSLMGQVVGIFVPGSIPASLLVQSTIWSTAQVSPLPEGYQVSPPIFVSVIQLFQRYIRLNLRPDSHILFLWQESLLKAVDEAKCLLVELWSGKNQGCLHSYLIRDTVAAALWIAMALRHTSTTITIDVSFDN